jgi:hypothetical protein
MLRNTLSTSPKTSTTSQLLILGLGNGQRRIRTNLHKGREWYLGLDFSMRCFFMDADKDGMGQSFGGGNDGHGAPLFSNLEAAKQKHMYDGYEDMKPKDGFIGGIYRKLVNAKHATGSTPHTK